MKCKKIEAVSDRKLDSSKGICLLACSFFAIGNNQEIVCGKREGVLEKKRLKSKEEIGSGEKVEKFAEVEHKYFFKVWGRKKKNVSENITEQECEEIHLVPSSLRQEEDFSLNFWS